MERERLEQCIERALGRTQFRNVWRQHFGAGAMHELYARKRHHEYCLNGANSVAVREDELADLVSAIVPMLAPYRASDSGAVGNGLYRLTGALASPRLPSVEDYARILVLAAARTGPGRSAATFCGWVEGQPIPVWQCFLLKGVLNDGRISPRDGLVLETLLGNGEEFPRSLYVQLDAGDSGNSPEIQFRIATRGAWLLGDTYDERKTCFDTLRKAYGLASSILHGRGLKRKNREEDAGTVGRAQELCREALLRMGERERFRTGTKLCWARAIDLRRDALDAEEDRRLDRVWRRKGMGRHQVRGKRTVGEPRRGGATLREGQGR